MLDILRIALASLEANAQQAQALSDLYAVVDAPVPGFDGFGLEGYATPHLSAETQHRFDPTPGSTAAGRSAAA